MIFILFLITFHDVLNGYNHFYYTIIPPVLQVIFLQYRRPTDRIELKI